MAIEEGSSGRPERRARGTRTTAPLADVTIDAAILLALAVALLWPAWINGHPLVFFDTGPYLIQGRVAAESALATLLPATGAPDMNGAAAEDPAASANFIRSLGYAGFAYVTSLTPIGTFGTALAQSLLITGLLAILAGRGVLSTGTAWAAAAAAVVTLTPLPWFASFLMPDIFAAVVILVAVIMVRGIQDLGWIAYLFLLGTGTFAALAHYGHMPLALAAGGAAIVVLALQRRLTLGALVLGLAPAILAAGINAAGSQVAFSEPSVAPKRMPLLLARSIEDGPARWYLEEACPDRGYAICEVFGDRLPDHVGVILWGEDGLLRRGTLEQHVRIREEEFEILAYAFMAYPLHQAWSLAGNSVRQLGMIGTDDLHWGRLALDADGDFVRIDEGRAGLDAVATMHVSAALVSLLVIGVFAWRDGLSVGRREREMLLILFIALAANAAIFGGLSAPADRYQARVIWLVSVLAALFWLTRRRPRTGTA
jgi:hypothetical protein